MADINSFELHYYLANDSHALDAFVRNKCEAEILSIVLEIASELDIDARILADAVAAGGFRDFWRVLGQNSGQITVLLVILQILITTLPSINESEGEKLENELNRLKIEETKLNIEKLQNELEKGNTSPNAAEAKSNDLVKNYKINKRRSNFYATLNSNPGVEAVGITVVDSQHNPISEESNVGRPDFGNYILTTNKLKSEDIETEIEIISPVLKEGRYKWRGLYRGEAISFEMQDHTFRDSVLMEDLPFQHGSSIYCVLRISRELDEVGEIKVSGYAVTTVIEKIDHGRRKETQQGKAYRHAKAMSENQNDFFD